MSCNYFIVIKREGYTPRGARLTALESASALLAARLWPLWDGTRNRRAIKAGDRIAVYLSGDGGCRVVATALVGSLGPWTSEIARRYPLDLDGTPFVVMHLDQVELLPVAVEVKEARHRLSFINKGSKKWGVAFMGGTRAVSAVDFVVLTTPGSAGPTAEASRPTKGRRGAIARVQALMTEHGLSIEDLLASA